MMKRTFTRIELTPPTRAKLTEVSRSNGMTQLVVLSRIVQWFSAQPQTIQAAVLGLYPSEIQPDIAAMILKRMKEGGGRFPIETAVLNQSSGGLPGAEMANESDARGEAGLS
jgi:hypothetical protein